MEDLETKEVYQRILLAGGGQVQAASLLRAIREGFDWSQVTHIIADPWILESGDRRYGDFQQWLNYERKVSGQNGRAAWSNGDGGTWKIFYTFLYQKLVSAQPIAEAQFEISRRSIQKEARARARLRSQIKEKKELEEAEAEVVILKEKIGRRNQDRSYRDKTSGGNQSQVWPESEQKRKSEWKDDISSRNKRPRESAGWPFSDQFAHFLIFLLLQDHSSGQVVRPMNFPGLFMLEILRRISETSRKLRNGKISLGRGNILEPSKKLIRNCLPGPRGEK